jgi:hypothetical protein
MNYAVVGRKVYGVRYLESKIRVSEPVACNITMVHNNLQS